MSTKLVAKTVVKDKFWVITDGNEKVGNVVAGPEGVDLKINGSVEHFKNTATLKKLVPIEFTTDKVNKTTVNNPFEIYPTPKKIYNSMLDVKRKLHLFTKTNDSKCYHAAGWFNFTENEELGVQFCPKYIFVQRYNYQGPFKTKEEALINIK